jgi:hypothetical protein
MPRRPAKKRRGKHTTCKFVALNRRVRLKVYLPGRIVYNGHTTRSLICSMQIETPRSVRLPREEEHKPRRIVERVEASNYHLQHQQLTKKKINMVSPYLRSLGRICKPLHARIVKLTTSVNNIRSFARIIHGRMLIHWW